MSLNAVDQLCSPVTKMATDIVEQLHTVKKPSDTIKSLATNSTILILLCQYLKHKVFEHQYLEYQDAESTAKKIISVIDNLFVDICTSFKQKYDSAALYGMFNFGQQEGLNLVVAQLENFQRDYNLAKREVNTLFH